MVGFEGRYSTSLGRGTVGYLIIDLNPVSPSVHSQSTDTPTRSQQNHSLLVKEQYSNHEALKPKKLHNIKKCCRWKKCSVEINRKTFRQQEIQSLLDNFLDKTFHCNREGGNLAAEN